MRQALTTLLWVLGVAQGAAALVVLWRLLPGLRRSPAVERHAPIRDTTVTVIVPTLNEATRIGPCLAGLARQSDPLIEVIVVDSGSTDGTIGLVEDAASRDPRLRLERDPPLPAGWIGKVWALQHGLSLARGEWVLGLDADTEPNDGLVAGVVAAARVYGLGLVSFAPTFAGQTAAERWLQPSLLTTLVYRTGAPGASAPPERMLANGQCFLARRDVLRANGGYESARHSFADDVRVARYYASLGVPCGFLDGRLLFRVRSYRTAGEMWREWGRSIALVDATGSWRRFVDLSVLFLAMALPLPMLAVSAGRTVPIALTAINLVLLATRLAVLKAIAPSYETRGVPFLASVFADPAAVFRVLLSTLRRPKEWRGRVYGADWGQTPAGERKSGV